MGLKIMAVLAAAEAETAVVRRVGGSGGSGEVK